MAEQTLEELKAENASAETEEEEQPTAAATETDEEEAATEEAQDTESEAETDEEEGAETDAEAWMQSDEQASEGGGEKRFTDSDVAAAKRKLQAKLEKRHTSEVDDLKREIEALKKGQGVQQQAPTGQKPMPTLEAHDYDETAYQKAMQDWVVNNAQSVTKSTLEQQRQEEQQKQQRQALEDAVGGHYQRAAKLAQEAGISDEVYQQTDLEVRKAIDSAMPGQGDLVADQLISRLGEGSEKVMYYLGRNTGEREKLSAALRTDPSGLSAVILLGELKGRLSSPPKKTSKAPAPARRAEGGSGGDGKVDKLRRAYQKETDTQKRFDMRRKAKQDGIDVSNW